jgi:HYR domain
MAHSLISFVVALASDQPPSNRPPVARCKDVQVIAGTSCSASPTATDVDAGSSDPDGDPITLALSPAGPVGLGSHAVNLTATDPNGSSSSCQAVVTVVDQTPPTVSCPGDKAAANDAGLCSATVDPGLPAATDACSAASVVGVRSDGQSLTGPYPVGTTMITWTAMDSSGNQASCAQRVAVADLQAPVISTVSVDNPTLWPPNHNMVDVAVTYDVADDWDAPAAVSCALGVVSNEPVHGLGDGDTAPDWEILDSHHVRLRSERAGGGTGRIYTISITCGDSRGHSSARTVDVVVPKSQK